MTSLGCRVGHGFDWRKTGKKIGRIKGSARADMMMMMIKQKMAANFKKIKLRYYLRINSLHIHTTKNYFYAKQRIAQSKVLPTQRYETAFRSHRP